MILDQMRVYNLRRQGNFKERFDRLMKMGSKAFNELLSIAKTKNRNYIMDQTNVFARARSRKIGTFSRWGRKVAAVCIPTMKDYQIRQAGCAAKNKVVPPDVVAKFKKNFELPRPGEFDEILWTDTKPPEAEQILRELQNEGYNYRPKRGRDDDGGGFQQNKRQRGNNYGGGRGGGGYNQ